MPDGERTAPVPEGFVLNAPIDEVKAAYVAHGIPEGQGNTPFNPTVIRTAGKTVLVDTGCGADTAEEPGATAGFLMRNLAAIGIGPDDVDVVVISHFHGDHVSGLVAPDGGPAFPTRRDHRARERVELLDGRRRARAGDAGPDGAALRAQPPGLRPARRAGADPRLGRGGGTGRDRDRDARAFDRAHLLSRLLAGRERLPDPGRVESPGALARAPRLASRLRPGSGRGRGDAPPHARVARPRADAGAGLPLPVPRPCDGRGGRGRLPGRSDSTSAVGGGGSPLRSASTRRSQSDSRVYACTERRSSERS